MLQIDLSPLIGARPGRRLTFLLDEGPQLLDDVHISFLQGRMQFTRLQNGILVEAQVATASEVDCMRCLDSFQDSITHDVEEIIGFAGQPAPDVTYQIDEEGLFDPLPLIREQVWVNKPIKILCRSDCRGICPVCGVNLNLVSCDCKVEIVDPRLAPLLALKEKSE